MLFFGSWILLVSKNLCNTPGTYYFWVLDILRGTILLSQLVTVKRACSAGTRKKCASGRSGIMRKEEKCGNDNLIYFPMCLGLALRNRLSLTYCNSSILNCSFREKPVTPKKAPLLCFHGRDGGQVLPFLRWWVIACVLQLLDTRIPLPSHKRSDSLVKDYSANNFCTFCVKRGV